MKRQERNHLKERSRLHREKVRPSLGPHESSSAPIPDGLLRLPDRAGRDARQDDGLAD
jgi:hypothetical protein